MTDIIPLRASRRRAAAPAALPAEAEADRGERERLVSCVELFFFAYRDFTRDPDAVLEEYEFGRAHHRVLHFVHRNPGLRVAHLLEILKITKQSLARVLKQLVDENFIVQKAGAADRRERLLYVTAKGSRLADKLTALQVARVSDALKTAGSGAETAMREFLFAMISPDDRARVEQLLKRPGALGEATRP